MNIAAIGAVIGHEITHGFDDQGQQFDKSGNLVDWWTDETKKRFTEGAQCFIKQYGAIVDSETSQNVCPYCCCTETFTNPFALHSYHAQLNGINTVGEN